LSYGKTPQHRQGGQILSPYRQLKAHAVLRLSTKHAQKFRLQNTHEYRTAKKGNSVMLSQVAKLLHTFFATDQSYYAEQQPDGTYRKKPGLVTPIFLEKNLTQNGSIAIYQKNSDTTLKWICFDFDILKSNLNSPNTNSALTELKRCVKSFCSSLGVLEIPYLLEVSGNRGFHVWITFKEKISYRIGHDIQQAILENIALTFDTNLIGIDLFPSNSTPTDGVGLGVKIPLSKHKKSGQYSQLLNLTSEIESYKQKTELDEELINSHVAILSKHISTSKTEIESALGIFFDLTHDETLYQTRIKSIKVQNNGFDMEDLETHWSSHPPLNSLKIKIFGEHQLNNEERKLIVGIFGNINCKNIENLHTSILISIFSKTKNYNIERTKKAIKALASFYFPSQEQIEKTTGIKFSTQLTIDELISACIPKYTSYEDGTFELSSKDIEITRIAELNYLFLNDEAQSRTVINNLSTYENQELLVYIQDLLAAPKSAQHYRHIRHEETKDRTLISLKAPERILTSCILKQLIYFLDIQPNQNSHGYKPNKGFSGGHIFQPWLYLWIKFVSNISSSIEDKNNANYYIVKTDIRSFYDKVPHDNLKRLLLGGVNPRVDIKRNQLKGAPEKSYISLINALFEITETITKSNTGLPQGPAYARYLAELYLDNIDNMFEDKIKKGELISYQRYVDDIFFIAPSESTAKETQKQLTDELELLGLEINNEKTKITQIKNFSEDFQSYRAQSKYAVDRVSKNFADATETQQNVAINEFMTLVQSDSCEDDLAFIFSHLNGIPQLDEWKNDRVIPIIRKGIGRGTLYKHLFNFVLDNKSNWKSLDQIDSFTPLQSEVLTATFINILETHNLNTAELNELFERLQTKLSPTEMTGEHLAYLAITFKTKIDTTKIPQNLIINSLASTPTPQRINVPTSTIAHLNTALNDIKSLSDFTRVVYPICASSDINKQDLNSLASTFYAKLSADELKNLLCTQHPPEIKTAATAAKFYYLLCLFSASSKNSSIELLKSMWKYCALLYNSYDTEQRRAVTPNWFKKIGDIDTDDKKIHFIISSIVDGNIFRGLEDNSKIFERFHNLLLLFVTFKDDMLPSKDLNDALETLKDKAQFYAWLIDRENVSLFPNSRLWFEKNVIENNSIILKKQNNILFRKPTASFHESSSPQNEHNGYSETIEPYEPANLSSLTSSLEDLTVKQKIHKLISIVEHCNNSDLLPNIYCNERILNQNTLLPFSNELIRSESLIFEDQNGNVTSLTNDQKNFISCFFDSANTGRNGDHLRHINDKYLKNLDREIDTFAFLKQISIQLDDVAAEDSEFYFDAAAAAALHTSMSELDPIRRIERFVTQYHRFNQDSEDRHIYGIYDGLTISEETPLEILDTIEHSTKSIPSNSILSLALYLDRDIAQYRSLLLKLADRNESDVPALDLKEFRRAYHKILQTSGIININGTNHKFSNVTLFNVFGNTLQPFEVSHTIILNTSEHVYYYQEQSKIFIIALHSSISKIFRSIESRADIFCHDGKFQQSYPENTFNRNEIKSIEKFHIAKEVVAVHRNIQTSDAETILVNWLKYLPKKFHKTLITLISAHVVMNQQEIKSFTLKVKELLENPATNPFMIKQISDFNGTHRILYKDGEIGRSVSSFSPTNLTNNVTTATLITDNIISGSQVSAALKYYATGENPKKSANYFELNEAQTRTLKETMKNLKQLNICTVLYTQTALKKINDTCKTFLNPDIEIKIIQGRDIADDALFGTTQKIGEQEKASIRSLLNDTSAMQILDSHFNKSNTFNQTKSISIEEINNTNLIARFQSLPKKCFKFLCSGLKHDADCHPLMRIKEANE
jgi:uncharacterized protein with NAD-binding domain and iron-sulfur cluster